MFRAGMPQVVVCAALVLPGTNIDGGGGCLFYLGVGLAGDAIQQRGFGWQQTGGDDVVFLCPARGAVQVGVRARRVGEHDFGNRHRQQANRGNQQPNAGRTPECVRKLAVPFARPAQNRPRCVDTANMPAQRVVVGSIMRKHLRGRPQPANQRDDAQHSQPGASACLALAYLRADGVVHFVVHAIS